MNGLIPASAFLVQFRAVAVSDRGKLAGRIEHVASGRTANFKSVEDVPRLLRQMLEEARGEDADKF